MKWLRHDMRTFWDGYVAFALVLLAILIAATSSGCTYEPMDENGQCYRPWNDDPYAMVDAPILDRILYTHEEKERRDSWKKKNSWLGICDWIRR